MKESGKRHKVYQISAGMIIAALIVALIWRIQCCILYYDETLSAYISYMTAVMGQRHLVENGYIFSMGDIFNLPFVYLFYHITGGTEGMILFLRFVYLGYNIVLSVVLWKIFGEYIGKKTMALFGLVLITFFPAGMYTIYYDTSAFFFSLLGCSLLLGSELRGNDRTGIYRYFAGICHACMAYAYPLMAGVVLILLIGVTIYHLCNDHMKGKELFRYWLPYFFGGMTIVGIFLAYVTYVGWENIFLFQEGFFQNSLGGREIGELASIANQAQDVGAGAGQAGGTALGDAGTNASAAAGAALGGGANASSAADAVAGGAVQESQAVGGGVADSLVFAMLKRIGSQVFQLLNYMWIQQKVTLGFTLVMLVQWGIGLVKKGKWRLLLLPEIILVGFFTHTDMVFYGGTAMYAYCFCWAPFLLCYLEPEKRKRGITFFVILGLTAAASFFAMGFTSVRLDIAHTGLYCGAICSFLLMLMLVREEYVAGIPLPVALLLLVATCNTYMAYNDHCQGADIKDCTYRMQKGVFKGMMTWEQDVGFEHMAELLKAESFRDGATIYITDYDYYAACMEGDLLSTRGNASIKEEFSLPYAEQLLQGGMESEEIYDMLYWPDVVIVDKENESSYAFSMETVLAEHYELASDEYDYYLYFKESFNS